MRQKAVTATLGVLALSAMVSMRPPPVETATLPMAAPESVGMSSERLARVTSHVQEHVDKGLIAGAVTLIAREGQVVHLESHGYRNREENIPMEVDDIFVIMSMTKPIMSTALMMLHEEGKFLLTDPISKFLPEFAEMQVRTEDGGLVPARPITIRHVLSQSSGVTRDGGGEVPPVRGDSPIRAQVRQLSANPLRFQPGERWEYTNGGISSDVVAALVEVISGQSPDAFLRQRIFEPLGMHETFYNVPPELWDRRARAYDPQREENFRLEPRPVTDPTPTDLFRGVAGLSSTAADYFKFAQMVMNGGEYEGVRLLSPKTISLMISNHIGDLPISIQGPGYKFGLGYSILTDPGQARESLSPGSFGWLGAWGTYYFNDPVEEVVGILMVQITSSGHLNLRSDLATLAMQAIVDAKSTGDQRIRAYATLE